MTNGNKSKQRVLENKNPAVKELVSYRFLLRDIARLKEEINEAEQVMVSLKAIRYDLPKVQGGTGESPIERAVIIFVELEQKYGMLKREREKRLEIINAKMEKLESRQQTVLRLYYIEGMTIDRIAKTMCYSEKQIGRLKKEGISRYSLA